MVIPSFDCKVLVSMSAFYKKKNYSANLHRDILISIACYRICKCTYNYTLHCVVISTYLSY